MEEGEGLSENSCATHPRANGSPPICAVAFFLPPTARAGVSEPSQKMGVARFVFTLTFATRHARVNELPAYRRRRRKQLRISEANRSLLGESRTSVRSHREVWRSLMNMLMSWKTR